MSKLEGRLVVSLLDDLDEPELLAIDRQIGEILRTLHSIGFAEFGYVGTDGVVDPHPTNAAYMRFQFEKKLREFVDLGGDGEIRSSIEKVVAERAELLAGSVAPSFCQGDPLLDLAKTYCYSRRRSETMLAALAAGYGDLRDRWRDAADLYVLYHLLELWDSSAATAETAPLASIAEELRMLTAP